jgi:TonB family protein
MSTRVGTLLCFVAVVSITLAAQTEPALTSANMPKYPPLACQARVEGSVKVTFTLAARAAEPTNVEVVSGHALLNSAALENVKTWRFDNPYAVERKYETTFEYRLSGKELAAGQTRKLTVSLESFHKLEIVTDVYQPTVNY